MPATPVVHTDHNARHQVGQRPAEAVMRVNRPEHKAAACMLPVSHHPLHHVVVPEEGWILRTVIVHKRRQGLASLRLRLVDSDRHLACRPRYALILDAMDWLYRSIRPAKCCCRYKATG